MRAQRDELAALRAQKIEAARVGAEWAAQAAWAPWAAAQEQEEGE